MTAKTKRGRGTKWTDQEIGALMLGITNHTPLATIAKFVGRTEEALLRRLSEHHKDAWLASGHPQCHPWKSEGKAKAKAAATRKASASPPMRDERVDGLIAMVHDQDTMINALAQRLARLEDDLGVCRG